MSTSKARRAQGEQAKESEKIEDGHPKKANKTTQHGKGRPRCVCPTAMPDVLASRYIAFGSRQAGVVGMSSLGLDD